MPASTFFEAGAAWRRSYRRLPTERFDERRASAARTLERLFGVGRGHGHSDARVALASLTEQDAGTAMKALAREDALKRRRTEHRQARKLCGVWPQPDPRMGAPSTVYIRAHARSFPPWRSSCRSRKRPPRQRCRWRRRTSPQATASAVFWGLLRPDSASNARER